MNITDNTKKNIDSCRFCWMCRHICPIGNATGLERNTARARALALSMVYRGAEKLEDMSENLYECTLCGACVKECVTGWDPIDFTLAARTEASLNGILPEYIAKLLENFSECGNIFAKELNKNIKFSTALTDTLIYFGETTRYALPSAIAEVSELLNKCGAKYTSLEEEISSGNSIYFITGKTAETKAQAEKCAEQLNRFSTVVVYDPADLKMFIRIYKELGINITAEIIGFNAYILKLIKADKINIVWTDKVYTAQDNFNYSRDLEDSETVRKLIGYCGNNKEMLLYGKDTMFAGSLLMNEYMPKVMKAVATKRIDNLKGVGATTVITESPDEYALLKNADAGIDVLSVEQMLLKSIRR